MRPWPDTILRDLNERQRAAVTVAAGPVLVIAGPGSGKTRALTHRVAYLIASGVPPASILAVTFTNKAAGEMRERVRKLLAASEAERGARREGPLALYHGPFIGTFHSFAAHVLRREAGRIGYRANFTIYDEDDRLALIKELMRELGILTERIPPAMAQAIISNLKADLVDPDAYEAAGAEDPFGRAMARLYRTYQERLALANAMDFDDLIFHAVRLFRRDPKTLERWQDRYRYLHVDEYQDTNTSQYELIRLLAQKYRNLFAIGDDAQCLPLGTRIDTPGGPRPIEQIKTGDLVLSGAGFGKLIPSRVVHIHRREGGEPLRHITTTDGRQLLITAGHMVFAKLQVDPNIFYVYLMERNDKGFRIGHTRGVRGGTRNGVRIMTNGLQVRANQEAADKIWILKVAHTKEEAILHEQLLAFRYGIPTTVFYDKGRNISLSQTSIDYLFSEIDSRKRAERLFSDLHLSREHPHHRPRGITRDLPYAPTRSRAVVDVCFFGGSQPSARYPWHDHRIALISASSTLREKFRRLGQWSIRSAKNGHTSWRIETARKRYEACREFVRGLMAAGGLEVHEKARLAQQSGNFDLMPASHLRPGMMIPVLAGKEVHAKLISTVKEEPYTGFLYDLSIENTHNYSANGIIVHNSIYGWRHADYRNILNFEADWSEATVILLEENYRSTPEILAAANQVIAKNRDQKSKSLFTQNPAGEQPRVSAHEHERAEAEFIAAEVNLLRQEHALAWRECAALYRTNAQSRALEEAMLEQGIPYVIIGAVPFFQRREVKDLIAYLRYLGNPEDVIALKRIVNVPSRGIGPKTFLALLAGKREGLADRERGAIRRFEETISALRAGMAERSLAEFLRFLIKTIGYESYLNDSSPEAESRRENIRELVSVARRYDALPIGEAITAMAEEGALASEQDDLDDDDRVRLMTLHNAKGLEFGAVFMAGLEEGLLPHARSIQNGRAELEEERRLCYVGMTRAKTRLYLTWALSRTLFGELQVNMPSRFLRELPPEVLAGEIGHRDEKLLITEDDES